MRRFGLLLIIGAMLAVSCSQQGKINKYNMASTYVEHFPGRLLQEQIYHQNDSLSDLNIRIDASKIPGLKSQQLDIYSLMRVNYAVYSSLNKKDIVQSDSYKLSDIIAFDKLNAGAVVLRVPLHLLQGKNYIISISIVDPVNKKNFRKLLRITKNNDSPENYKIVDEKGDLIWHSWIKPQQKIKIVYRYPATKIIYISYLKPKFPPARPPYSEDSRMAINPKVFDRFQIELNQGVSSIYQLPYEGVYKVHAKENNLGGKLLVQYYSEYPRLNNAQKVFVLRYLNNKKEFNQMLKDDVIHSIQEFWFFEGRSKERSIEMMNTYYARALRANELFSSYKEGWKTDRGMIFMIYGPADYVYYQGDKEVWEYGSEADQNDFKFEFIIQSTPLINQEYILYRDEAFKDSWYAAVENWRNGADMMKEE